MASRFAYDGDALVPAYGGWGNRLQRHVHLDGADTQVLSYHASETAPRQLMPDHQGSIVRMAQHGWSRIVVNSCDDYGYPGSTNTGRFQYAGQAWLAGLGRYYYTARMYPPGGPSNRRSPGTWRSRHPDRTGMYRGTRPARIGERNRR